MTVLIIGNGFDLNLGLPTSYEDYIKSSYFKEQLHKENGLAKYLKGIFKNQRWVDIENALTKYSKIADEDFENDYIEIVNGLIHYLETIDYKNLNKLSLAYKEISKLVNLTREKKEDFIIINFNYTNSIEYIFHELGYTEKYASEKIIHIHGSIKEKSIIFGVEDNASIKPNHIFLKKAFSPSYKSININTLLNKADTLTFFGHSLGNTDHSYFSPLISLLSLSDNTKRKVINLFYFGNEGYKNLMKELDILTNRGLTWFRQTNNVDIIDTSL